MVRLTIRVDFDNGSALGPGKVRLLELMAETGSIRRAAAGMKMSYRRAWLLLQALNEAFGSELVETATGGRKGGGASLTPLGRAVVREYRALEKAAAKAGAAHTAALTRRMPRIAARKKARSIRP